jgi:hypothetical protein
MQSPELEFSFDLQAAKAMQEAERYKNARDAALIIAGLAAFAAFFVEMRAWLEVSDLSLPFFILGPFGIFALFDKEPLANVIRPIFLVFAVPMLLLPILRGETKRLLLIGAYVCLYFVCRWLATWLANQRPRDWNTILTEKRRRRWGPEEFARALTRGRASDGSLLAFFTNPNEHCLPAQLREGSYMTHEPVTTLLRLRLKQRFRRADISANWNDLLLSLERDGCSPEERELMFKTTLYVHPEISKRVEELIGR